MFARILGTIRQPAPLTQFASDLQRNNTLALYVRMCNRTPSSAFFFTHDGEQPSYNIIFPFLAKLASDRSPLANPTFVPHSLSSDRAKLFIESCHARLGMKPRARRKDHRRHKCIPNSEEARVMVGLVNFISVFLGTPRVGHLRAIGKALSYQRQLNPGSIPCPRQSNCQHVSPITCRIQNLDKPEANREAHSGTTRRCRTGRRQIDSPRGQPSLLTPKASNTIVLTDFSEA